MFFKLPIIFFRASCKTLICLQSGSGWFVAIHWCETNAALPIFLWNSTNTFLAFSASCGSILVMSKKMPNDTVYRGKNMDSPSPSSSVLSDLAYLAKGVEEWAQPHAMATRICYRYYVLLKMRPFAAPGIEITMPYSTIRKIMPSGPKTRCCLGRI